MKKLQNNFTTLEQSKRLLELGVPADSADCYLNGDSVIILNGKTFQENYNEDLDLARLHLIEYPHYLPCWSVGRLIEIMNICSIHNIVSIYRTDRDVTQIDIILETIINRINGNSIDFLKLEEEHV
jgi:hypothetical protein